MDNGLDLNIYSKTKLDMVQDDYSDPLKSKVTIIGFDIVIWESLSFVTLPITLGIIKLDTISNVMHSTLVYNILLGPPLIHAMGVVPSTIHHNLKFIQNNRCVVTANNNPDQICHVEKDKTLISPTQLIKLSYI